MGLIKKLFGEKRSGFASPDAWLFDAFGVRPAKSGQSVNERTALNAGAVFACVRVISESVASLPLVLYERKERGKERAVGHPLYRLLHDQPNSEMTSFTFRETLQAHLLLWGNAYAYFTTNGAGQVAEIWPLLPDRTAPKRNAAGVIVYETQLADGSTLVLPSDRVLHVPGLGFNGLIGYSPVHMQREAIGLALATEEYGSRFFANGAKPGGVLEVPEGIELSEGAAARLKESWRQMHQGGANSHKVAVLEQGIKYHEIGIPPDDAQFLETRKFQRGEIASMFRVPPHMIGDLERATFSNIEQQSIDFVTHTLRPWLVRWEQAMFTKLLTPSEQQRYFAEFNVAGLLRGDMKSRYEAYAIGKQNSWLSANDIRELENMNAITDGDAHMVPLNMIPADRLDEYIDSLVKDKAIQTQRDTAPQRRETTTIEAKEARTARTVSTRRGIIESFKPITADAYARCLRREKADVMREAERYFGKRDKRSADVSQFKAWLQDFYRDHQEFVRQQLEPVVDAIAKAAYALAAEEVGRDDAKMGAEVREFIEDYIDKMTTRHTSESQAVLLRTVEKTQDEQGDEVEAMRQRFDAWQDRPASRGRDEAHRLFNAVALATYSFMGVRAVRWVASGKSCAHCRNLEGKVMQTGHAFVRKGDEHQGGEGDEPMKLSHNVRHAPLHSGCDCHTVAEID